MFFAKRSWLAWLSLFFGLCFTFATTYILKQQQEKNARDQFELHVQQLVAAIDKRLKDHELILRGAAGLMDVNYDASRQQWRDYIQRLSLAERYPGIQGVGYTEIFPASGLDAHVAAIRAEGFVDYSVKPEGVREIYSGIKYLEPFKGRNLAAFGYDMFSNAVRRAAMQRAVDENTTSISGKVKLVQETHGKEQAGFLMYVPIYRAGLAIETIEERWRAIKGYVYSPYRMDDLMAGIFNRDQMQVDFQLFDGPTDELEAMLYDSSLGQKDTGQNIFLAKQNRTFFGRQWTIKVSARDGFYAQFKSHLDGLIPAMGVGISFSLFIMILILQGRRESAQRLADIMVDKYKSARENFQQQMSDVLSAASEVSIIVTDTEGIITMFNTGAERLLGYRGEELIGKQSPAIFHDPEEIRIRSEELSKQLGMQVEGFRTFVEIPEREGSEKREWSYKHKLGYFITVSLVVTPVRDALNGNINGYLGMAEDITERKRVEHLKSEFVSTVSHELRTPLTAITGALKLISSGILDASSDKNKEMLAIALSNSERLSCLVNDLLDFERITGGQLQFEFRVQPIKPLIEKALAAHQTFSIKDSVDLSLSGVVPDVTVNVDANRFLQVLANLISNALKFSPAQSKVTIAVEIIQDRIKIIVSDQGPGISAEFERRIFQRFAQADSSDSRQNGGTGLGLAISQELIKGMKGSIGFYNNPDKGASFWVELPLN